MEAYVLQTAVVEAPTNEVIELDQPETSIISAQLAEAPIVSEIAELSPPPAEVLKTRARPLGDTEIAKALGVAAPLPVYAELTCHRWRDNGSWLYFYGAGYATPRWYYPDEGIAINPKVAYFRGDSLPVRQPFIFDFQVRYNADGNQCRVRGTDSAAQPNVVDQTFTVGTGNQHVLVKFPGSRSGVWVVSFETTLARAWWGFLSVTLRTSPG